MNELEALKEALKLQQQINSELNEQLRTVRLELAQEQTRLSIVEGQKTSLKAQLRYAQRRLYANS